MTRRLLVKVLKAAGLGASKGELKTSDDVVLSGEDPQGGRTESQ